MKIIEAKGASKEAKGVAAGTVRLSHETTNDVLGAVNYVMRTRLFDLKQPLISLRGGRYYFSNNEIKQLLFTLHAARRTNQSRSYFPGLYPCLCETAAFTYLACFGWGYALGRVTVQLP
jgi:hypothetical protein